MYFSLELNSTIFFKNFDFIMELNKIVLVALVLIWKSQYLSSSQVMYEPLPIFKSSRFLRILLSYLLLALDSLIHKST